MLKFILYMLLAVVILSGGIFKTFAVNYGISKYLSKRPYKGDFEFKKVALHTLETNFILLTIEVSKNKKMKLSFFTALANAPYELLIPYGQFGAMIFKSTIL